MALSLEVLRADLLVKQVTVGLCGAVPEGGAKAIWEELQKQTGLSDVLSNPGISGEADSGSGMTGGGAGVD